MLEIKTYSELKKYIKAFGQRKIGFLTILSRGGLGKSFLTEEILAEQAPLILNGHITPLSLYKTLQNENNEDKSFILVIDDLDGILHNKTNVAILKAVCDTKETKIVKYTSTTRLLSDDEKEFETNCKVILLANSLNIGNDDLTALATRANIINFCPPNIEILNFLKTFAEDKEIINFIAKYAKFSRNLNLRVYARAVELKRSLLDWQQEIINSMQIDKDLVEFENLKKYKTDKERIEHFSKSKATYFRIKKILATKNIC
jgi:hypothetical protein